MRLLIWLREHKLKQRHLAEAIDRSNAWISRRVRDQRIVTAEDRKLIRAACARLAGRRVRMADLFEPEQGGRVVRGGLDWARESASAAAPSLRVVSGSVAGPRRHSAGRRP